jgi:hypothetical protein
MKAQLKEAKDLGELRSPKRTFRSDRADSPRGLADGPRDLGRWSEIATRTTSTAP